MRSVNKVILIGYAGKDPELRHTSGGTPVAEFSMATSDKWKDKQTGEEKERTDWHTITAWGRLAEIVAEYVVKGAPVYIEGSIRMETWEKDGKTNYRTKIQALTLNLLGNPPESKPAAKPAAAERVVDHSFDDDIPF